jgi:hypothetical protein
LNKIGLRKDQQDKNAINLETLNSNEREKTSVEIHIGEVEQE